MKFLTDEPALLVDKTLIVADLHLGIEYEFYQSGIKIPSQTEKIKNRIDELLKITKAKKLIFLGDVKHKVPGISFQEMREVPEFLNYFNKKVPVEVIPGNHDGDIEKLIPNIKINPSSGFLFNKKFYLSHGHTWPGKEFLKADFLLIGHTHPQIEFKDKLGYIWREPVWVRSKLKKNMIFKKYKKIPTKPLMLIILPTFNSFAGGMAVNRKEKDKEFLGPISKCADMKRAKIYLLDGTYLGELKNL